MRHALILNSAPLCSVDRASRYSPLNEASLVHNLSYYVYSYLFSLHVSGVYVPIIRRNNCIYATLGTCYSTLHTRQPSIQNNKYQVSHTYSCFSLWWAHSRPKHAQLRIKHSKKDCTKLALFTTLNVVGL